MGLVKTTGICSKKYIWDGLFSIHLKRAGVFISRSLKVVASLMALCELACLVNVCKMWEPGGCLEGIQQGAITWCGFHTWRKCQCLGMQVRKLLNSLIGCVNVCSQLKSLLFVLYQLMAMQVWRMKAYATMSWWLQSPWFLQNWNITPAWNLLGHAGHLQGQRREQAVYVLIWLGKDYWNLMNRSQHLQVFITVNGMSSGPEIFQTTGPLVNYHRNFCPINL